MLTPDEIIDILGLEPLPHEGGAFRETYRSTHRVPGPAGTGGDRPAGAAPPPDRAASTQIYYMLRPGESSALHRVRSDEVFHHYLGDPVTQLRIDDGSRTFGEPSDSVAAEVVTIGPDLRAGQRPQVLAPRDVWQGAVLATPADSPADTRAGTRAGTRASTRDGSRAGSGPHGFALLGCTVAPGFEWEDFELITAAAARDFAERLPDHAPLIDAMTPAPGRTRA